VCVLGWVGEVGELQSTRVRQVSKFQKKPSWGTYRGATRSVEVGVLPPAALEAHQSNRDGRGAKTLNHSQQFSVAARSAEAELCPVVRLVAELGQRGVRQQRSLASVSRLHACPPAVEGVGHFPGTAGKQHKFVPKRWRQ